MQNLCISYADVMSKVTASYRSWDLPLHFVSFTPGRIFIKLWTNVHLSKTACKTYISAMQTQGQDHSPMSFLSKTVCRTYASATQMQCQRSQLAIGLGIYPCISSPLPLEGFSLNFGQMFISVRRCAEPKT